MSTAGTIVSTAATIIESPLVSMIGMFVPEAEPIIAILQRFAPTVAAAEPAIEEAVKAGAPVFEAAVTAAPKFATLVGQIMHHLPAPTAGAAHMGGLADLVTSTSSPVIIENITRMLGGFPKMSQEEEMAWMNSMTPHNDPSQENSKFGG